MSPLHQAAPSTWRENGESHKAIRPPLIPGESSRAASALPLKTYARAIKKIKARKENDENRYHSSSSSMISASIWFNVSFIFRSMVSLLIPFSDCASIFISNVICAPSLLRGLKTPLTISESLSQGTFAVARARAQQRYTVTNLKREKS